MKRLGPLPVPPGKRGRFVPCTGWRGCGRRGWVRGPGSLPMTHRRCAGDGWIRVGGPSRGRGGSGSPWAGLWKKAKRAGIQGGALLGGGWLVGGTVGVSVVAVLMLLVLGLRVHRVVAGALR